MAPTGAGHFSDAALLRRQELVGTTGPKALFKNMRVFGVACFACLGGLLYGYNQGVFSGVLVMPAFKTHMGEWVVNGTKQGWLVAILELGAWLGTLYIGFLAEILSRKFAIMINVVIFIIGVIIQATAISAGPSAILGGRFVTGMGVGALATVVPMYCAEIAPPEVNRGQTRSVKRTITYRI